MPTAHTFNFKGGVTQIGSGGTAKFLLFFLNGNKEVSFTEAKRYQFVEQAQQDYNRLANSTERLQPDAFVTDLSVVKVMLQESTFGKPKLQQFFFLALGSKLEKQVVTIRPRNLQARGLGYQFKAEAKFLKRSEVLALLDPESIGYKVIARQQTPPTEILREIISIERPMAAPEVLAANHGGVRHLRIRQ